MKKLNLNENFIGRIWQEPAYYDNLKTTDGKKVEVVDFGRINRDSGADFRNSKILIDGQNFSGDVEIHRTTKDWFLHKHKKSGKYNRVILQVVMWRDDDFTDFSPPLATKARKIPTVILSEHLSRSIHEIWRDIINNPSVNFKLICSPDNKTLDESFKRKWIDNLALKRLNYKDDRIEQKIKEYELRKDSRNKMIVWEQTFFEFICEALGFSKNKEQFLKFAGNIDIQKIKKLKLNRLQIESVFYGSAGLISHLKHKEEYIVSLKENWNILKDRFGIPQMDKSEWNFFRLRPQNFPTIRLAYASALLYEILYNGFMKKLIICLENNNKPVTELINIFSGIKISDYWNNHYVFGKEVKKIDAGIGKSRIKDIITNVLLPFVLLYSIKFNKESFLLKIKDFYTSVKQNERNEVTRVMEKQLGIKIKTISDEQGLLHLHNFYCVKEKCRDCSIGKKLYYGDVVSEILRIILY